MGRGRGRPEISKGLHSQIVKYLWTGMKQQAIAWKLGVSQSTVSKVKAMNKR